MRQAPGMIQPKEQVLLKWRSLCAEQEQSGQSAAGFCRARELHPSQFYYWKKRLREAAMPQFVEVRVRKPAMTPTDSRVGRLEEGVFKLPRTDEGRRANRILVAESVQMVSN